MTSFRTRLLVGSIIFAGGMLAVFHLASMTLFRRYPQSFIMRINHVWIVGIALVCIAIGVSMMRRGLSPFDELRARLTNVRNGSEKRLEGRYPSEVQPLVSDLNALLDHRDEVVRRALGKAGDLAHGLKTPLAVLLVEVQRAEDAVNMNWPPRCGCSSTGCAARSTTTSPTPAPPPPVPPSAPAAPSSNRRARSLER